MAFHTAGTSPNSLTCSRPPFVVQAFCFSSYVKGAPDDIWYISGVQQQLSRSNTNTRGTMLMASTCRRSGSSQDSPNRPPPRLKTTATTTATTTTATTTATTTQTKTTTPNEPATCARPRPVSIKDAGQWPLTHHSTWGQSQITSPLFTWAAPPHNISNNTNNTNTNTNHTNHTNTNNKNHNSTNNNNATFSCHHLPVIEASV